MSYSLFLSFTDWNGLAPHKSFIGLKNYIDFFKDPFSYVVLSNNIKWLLFALSIPTILGLLLAIVLNGPIRGRIFFRTIFYSPGIIPLVSSGVIWAWIYNPTFGALNSFLRMIGLGYLARGWLSDPNIALYSVMVTAAWQGVGMPMILFLAGLQDIPKELYEAAKIDGALDYHLFWYVTLPLLRETFIIVISLAIINSLKVFDLIYTMTWGGPGRSTQVLAVWMYFNAFQYYKAGYGSTIAWLTTVLSMAITIPYIRILSRR